LTCWMMFDLLDDVWPLVGLLDDVWLAG
jgi:hypothetical protein